VGGIEADCVMREMRVGSRRGVRVVGAMEIVLTRIIAIGYANVPTAMSLLAFQAAPFHYLNASRLLESRPKHADSR
jgi:hypothetical protein